ncbi:MAG: ATP-binding cassette domain-containing protein [Actinomycetota bacterium]|nr:ATP-binding cassette domain-containing protein [Actinomycetota bacterium]
MLELHDLTQRFGEVTALDGVTFSVQPGRICGFLGPNGAGKTTAMRAVMGILEPDAGTVRWNGQPVTDEVRRRFGYMPEERGLYKTLGVHEHLVYLARLHGLPRAEAAVNAERWIDQSGLAERAQSKVEELSLGNQQRVQLGAALVHEPELLVLDEPFSGLDPIGVDVMSDVLRKQAAQGVAVVFSSHQLDLVEDLCDEVVIVHRGRVVLIGEVGALKRQGRRRWAVGVDGDVAPRLATVSGVTVIDHRDDGVVVVELDDGVDARVLLAAAEGVAPLTHFSRELPLLSELFRQAVAA